MMSGDDQDTFDSDMVSSKKPHHRGIKFDETSKRQVAGLTCQFVDVSLSIVGSIFPVANTVHDIVNMFKPDFKHVEILENFNELKGMLKKISMRLEQNNTEDKWDHVKTRFVEAISNLEYCVKLSFFAMQADSELKKISWLEKLNEKGSVLESSLEHLFDGLSSCERGVCDFHDEILSVYYIYSRGHKLKMEKLCGYLIQIILNSLVAHCIQLASSKGVDWCLEVVTKFNYEAKLDASLKNMIQFVDKCVKECNVNIREDAREILFKQKLNSDEVMIKLTEKFDRKYVWLDVFFILYQAKGSKLKLKHVDSENNLRPNVQSSDECDGLEGTVVKDGDGEISVDEHFITVTKSDVATNLWDETDCANFADDKNFILVLFSQLKNENTRNVSWIAYKKAEKIVNDSLQFTSMSASQINQKIKKELLKNEIQFWGLATMKSSDVLGQSLSHINRSSLNVENSLIWICKHRYTCCLLLAA
ncbi:hypothetical protein HELRODRAFT_192555 [Helobdella robusta]|uniref:Uncharacterized protein n=1 Tax=Helobdella robusta TaxID=6412 RepID=T1FU28_HELRO|nr:hypothetical protein HELRODRAFT_192555 [Helobdella robusta]ESO00635.1 hypothetical protein HELRODRAFT_192555 [Helobdella robusta]